jgi:hypothetical protein
MLPVEQLVRIDRPLIEKYHPKFRGVEKGTPGGEKKGAPAQAVPRG